MSDFETMVMCILILAYGMVFYNAGRIDFFGLVIKIMEAKAKDLEEAKKDNDLEVK